MTPRLPLLLALSLLTACSGSFSGKLGSGDATPHPSGTAADVPSAPRMNTDRSRALFLIIVEELHKQGKSRAALAYLDDYDRLYPGDTKSALLRGNCLLDIADYDRAAQVFQRLQGGGNDPAAQAGLGQVAAARQDWASAQAAFQRAVRGNPSNAEYLNDLGFAQIQTGNYAAALSSLRQAQELDATNRMIRNNVILALHLAGRDADARAQIGSIAGPNDRHFAEGLLALTATTLPASTGTATVQSTTAQASGGQARP